MEADERVSLIVKLTAIFLILIGVTGIISGIYALNLVQVSSGETFSTKEASKSVLDASLSISKDRNAISTSLEDTMTNITEAAVKLETASSDIFETSVSLDKASINSDDSANSLANSASDDKEAVTELRSAADAMDKLWGPTSAAKEIRDSADKFEDSALEMESASESLAQLSLNLKDASSDLKHSSQEMKGVSNNLVNTGAGVSATSDSVESMTSRVTVNLNDLVEGLQWLDTADKKTILNSIIYYFILIHLMIAGTGIALMLIASNLYG
jgi:chromosome segregation ATPase